MFASLVSRRYYASNMFGKRRTNPMLAKPQHADRAVQRHMLRVLILVCTVVIALAASTIVMAQSSSGFQLGCWGITSASGHTHAAIFTKSGQQVVSSVGGPAVGRSSSPSYQVNGGYLQPLAGVSAASVESSTSTIPPKADLFLPYVSNIIRVVYVCPY